MGWLERMDSRNQRRFERARVRNTKDAQREPDDDGPLVAVGSYLSFVPSIVGLVGVAVMVIGAAMRRRRTRVR